jgi:hypothetical protein
MRFPDPALSPVAWRSLLSATSRTVAARVQVLDRNEDPLGALLPVVSGSVSVDGRAGVSRSVDLVALDVDDQVGLEASSPWQGAAFADRFVQVDYGLLDSATGVWYWTPVFRGPVIRYERERPEVRIGAQGKESLMLAPVHPFFKGDALTVPRATRVDDAVARIAKRCGEKQANLDLPWTTKRRTQQRISLGRTSEPWLALKRVATDAGLDLFFDGAGRLVLREPQADPVITFDSDLLTSWPNLTYDLGSDFRNIVLVAGKAHGKQDARPLGWGIPKANDPLSATSLARNGEPRFIAEYIEVDLSDKQKVQRIADQELSRRMRQAISVQFECLAVPGLEEGDPAAVEPPGEQAYQFTVASFGISLGADDMSVGTTRKVRVPKVASR